MGYELRGGNRYYYRKTRVNGRVVSSYCGGKLGGLMAEVWEVTTEANKQEQQALAALRQQENETDARLDDVCQQLRAAVKEGLQASGFHQHKGQWRKKRMATALVKTAKSEIAQPKLESVRQLAAYAEAVYVIDNWQDSHNHAYPPSALRAQLEAAQEAYPGSWRALGNLAKTELARLIECGWKNHYSNAKAVEAACENMRNENSYANASPLEKLAIDEVVLAWVRLHEVQAQNTLANHAPSLNHSNCDFWDKRLLNAQQRYLRACTNLARIRKLMKGVNFVQVNIAAAGSQQANMMGVPSVVR